MLKLNNFLRKKNSLTFTVAHLLKLKAGFQFLYRGIFWVITLLTVALLTEMCGTSLFRLNLWLFSPENWQSTSWWSCPPPPQSPPQTWLEKVYSTWHRTRPCGAPALKDLGDDIIKSDLLCLIHKGMILSIKIGLGLTSGSITFLTSRWRSMVINTLLNQQVSFSQNCDVPVYCWSLSAASFTTHSRWQANG